MTRTSLLVVFLVACSCASTQDRGERALSVANEVERLAGLRFLWPGFDPMAVPLAIYDGELTYLFRHPTPPEGFVPVDSTKGDVLAWEGRHPAIIANTSADIGQKTTATLMLDRSDKERDLSDLAAVALHEAFHVFQRDRHPGWKANEAELFVYPTSDAGLLASRRLETEALRRALAASGSTQSACWARRALALRADRFAGIDAVFVAYERGTELNEGLATYVEMRAKGQEAVVLPTSGFEATDVRRRAYAIGPALGLLLDRFHPRWPASFEADDRQSLDQALLAALEADSSDQCTFSEAETAEAGRVARDDVAALLARRIERRAAFEARPGWRLVVQALDGEPLWPQGFDPLNVERVQGGVVHMRFLRLGNDSGQLEAIDTPETDIEALTEGAGPHPLFNGVQRVVITGLAEPDVRIEGEHVTVQLSGLAASFERATVHESPRELVVNLEPTE